METYSSWQLSLTPAPTRDIFVGKGLPNLCQNRCLACGSASWLSCQPLSGNLKPLPHPHTLYHMSWIVPYELEDWRVRSPEKQPPKITIATRLLNICLPPLQWKCFNNIKRDFFPHRKFSLSRFLYYKYFMLPHRPHKHLFFFSEVDCIIFY